MFEFGIIMVAVAIAFCLTNHFKVAGFFLLFAVEVIFKINIGISIALMIIYIVLMFTVFKSNKPKGEIVYNKEKYAEKYGFGHNDIMFIYDTNPSIRGKEYSDWNGVTKKVSEKFKVLVTPETLSKLLKNSDDVDTFNYHVKKYLNAIGDKNLNYKVIDFSLMTGHDYSSIMTPEDAINEFISNVYGNDKYKKA